MVTVLSDIRVPLPYDAIESLCRDLGVQRLAVFGSVLREDFRPDSDIDFLADFANHDLGPWLCKLTDLETSLSTLLRRPVQVCDLPSVEGSRNRIFRDNVLSTARTIYAA